MIRLIHLIQTHLALFLEETQFSAALVKAMKKEGLDIPTSLVSYQAMKTAEAIFLVPEDLLDAFKIIFQSTATSIKNSNLRPTQEVLELKEKGERWEAYARQICLYLGLNLANETKLYASVREAYGAKPKPAPDGGVISREEER